MLLHYNWVAYCVHGNNFRARCNIKAYVDYLTICRNTFTIMITTSSLESVFEELVAQNQKVTARLQHLAGLLATSKEEVGGALHDYRGLPAEKRAFIIHRSGFQNPHDMWDYEIEIERGLEQPLQPAPLKRHE